MDRPCNEISAGSHVTQTDPALAHRSRFGWRASVHSKNDSRFSRQTPNVAAQAPPNEVRVQKSAALLRSSCSRWLGNVVSRGNPARRRPERENAPCKIDCLNGLT